MGIHTKTLMVTGSASVSGTLHFDGVLPSDLTVGSDSAADRTIVFGHTNVKSVIGLDHDSGDANNTVFAINTDASFEATNDLEITQYGDVAIKGDLTVGGNDIKNSEGTTTITLDTDENVTLAQNLTLANNKQIRGIANIKASYNRNDGTGNFIVERGSAETDTFVINSSGVITTMPAISTSATIVAPDSSAASLNLKADNSDNAGDDWAIAARTDNTFQIMNDIASAGSLVSQLTVTPDSTASNSVTEVGKLRLAGDVIQANDGEVAITVNTDGDITTRNITLTGNVINASDGGAAIQLDDDSNVKAIGRLILGGNSITNSDSEICLTTDADQNVGIGTTTPASRLHVKGDLTVEDGSSTDIIGKLYRSNDDGVLDIYNNNTVAARISAAVALSSFVPYDFAVGGDLTVTGLDIKDNGGDSRINLGDNLLLNDADGTTVIMLGASDLSTTLAGGLTIGATGHTSGYTSTWTGDMTVKSSSATDIPRITIHSEDTSTGDAGELVFKRYTDSTLEDGVNIGEIWFTASEDNSSFQSVAYILAELSEDFQAASAEGTRLVFASTNNGATAATVKMRIADAVYIYNGPELGTDSGGDLVIGASSRSSSHITIDNNEIESFSDETTGEILYLNYNEGGGVIVGSGLFQTAGDATFGGLTTCSDALVVNENSQYGYAATFFNDGGFATRYGIKIQCGHDTGSGTNYLARFYDGNGTSVGNITYSGATVTYGAFTGVHPATVEESESPYSTESVLANPDDPTSGIDVYTWYTRGTLLKTNLTSYEGNEGTSNVIYSSTKTSSSKDKSVLGVYLAPHTVAELIGVHDVGCVGDGEILMCSEGGNLEIGDYICSSNTPGHGMKQDDDLLHNYTVAKSLENVNWSELGITEKLVKCSLHAG